jgi:hypothetical protein
MTLPPAYGPLERQVALEKTTIAVQFLGMELQTYWLKAMFFGAAAGLALAAYVLGGLAGAVLVQIVAAAGGLFVAVCWAIATSASNFSLSAWQARVSLLEDYSIGALTKVDEGPGRRHPFKSGMFFSTPVLMMVVCMTTAALFAGLLAAAVLGGSGGFGHAGRVLAAILAIGFFGAASFAALLFSRRAPRDAGRGVLDVLRYIDLP